MTSVVDPDPHLDSDPHGSASLWKPGSASGLNKNQDPDPHKIKSGSGSAANKIRIRILVISFIRNWIQIRINLQMAKMYVVWAYLSFFSRFCAFIYSVADPKQKFSIRFRIRIQAEVSFGFGSRSETGQNFFKFLSNLIFKHKKAASLSSVTWLWTSCAINLLNLQDSDSDPLVRGTDPRIRIRILTKKSGSTTLRTATCKSFLLYCDCCKCEICTYNHMNYLFQIFFGSSFGFESGSKSGSETFISVPDRIWIRPKGRIRFRFRIGSATLFI